MGNDVQKDHPVSTVRWIPIEKIFANDYNPNEVAPPEMELLAKSIREDGYTQPVVCYYDKENDRYIVVDGFHRYRIAKENEDILASTEGCLPVVTINKSLSNRMASTVRHNRARGTHKIGSMADMVSQLYLSGWSNKRICAELGMDLDEINRLKQFTGLGILFKNARFSRADSDEHDGSMSFTKHSPEDA